MSIFDKATMTQGLNREPNPNIPQQSRGMNPALAFMGGGGGPMASTAMGALPGFMEKVKANVGQPSLIDTAGGESMASLQMGLDQATGTLDPNIQRSEQLSSQLQSLLMGNQDVSSIPGYNAMVSARGDAINDLGTGMAGTGKFFSGSTAQAAADIGGSMENQLIQQRIQNLMMGAQPGQQMGGQLAGMQMGTGTAGAQIPLSLAQMQMQQNIANQNAQAAEDANTSGFWGDVLGGAATLGGAAIAASDITLKENVKRIGKRGKHNWYQFTYKGSDTLYEGVMAHEVAKITPDAVIDMGNYKAVDYARL